jgi:hypothetical protein
MKLIDRRLQALENRFGSPDRPRPRLRLRLMDLGSKLCLEDAKCTRTLCQDGSLMEVVDFQKHDEGPDEVSEEELDRWVEGFPVQGFSPSGEARL